MNNTTSFYSTKRNSNVNVNNNKVCGYRIKNPWMKQGFSYGVKAGRDNGVVDQKLSRFATGQECNEAGQRCAGNTNWLNYKKGMGFTKPESSKTHFSLGNRNNLNAGDVGHYSNNVPDLKPNERKGRGNRLLERANFMASDIKPRMHFPFESLRTIVYGEEGTITASSKGLNFNVSMKIPDPTDFAWLREKARIIGVPARAAVAGTPGVPGKAAIRATGLYLAFQNLGSLSEIKALIERELSINPPLGRNQRTITKMTNDISNPNNKGNNTNVIAGLARLVRDGRAENNEGRIDVLKQLATVLTNVGDLNRLTRASTEQINFTIQRLKVPTNYQLFFSPQQPQIIDWEWLITGQNLGLFYTFILAGTSIDPILKPQTPMYNMYLVKRDKKRFRFWGVDASKQAIAKNNELPDDGVRVFSIGQKFLTAMSSTSTAKKAFFDLHRRAIISIPMARYLIENGASHTISPGDISKYIGSNSTIDGTPMPIMANSRKLDAAGNIQRAPIPPVFGDRSTVAPRAAPVGAI